jgi:hypothetical protein
MKKWLTAALVLLCMTLIFTLPAWAVEGGEVLSSAQQLRDAEKNDRYNYYLRDSSYSSSGSYAAGSNTTKRYFRFGFCI